MRIDFQVEGEKSLNLYPDDVYEVRIASVERAMSTTGNPQAKWSAVIANGAYAGKRITDFTMLTEKGIWKTVKLVKAALGIESFKALGVVDTDSQEFNHILQSCVGKQMQWVVGRREYNGKLYNNIQDYYPSAEQLEQTVSLDDLPEFLRETGQEG